ncbi:sulfotransferase [Pediococcus argentinicus]|uniref:Sulfotransferase domain-containing protein n=1 Tax=Pediococcus argentinicus TaxID=480391 RepID=A0A0R2NED1_9LACO|nr:sulfotransferase [Pediococcus argentinicus]KRO21955.1 hypothetical protein IV88_GL001327 [Pediococcus argentinicus]NKZ23104.1 sulfotransferase [Pediococcus argentinicus]GEP20245.1 sulfotransferase family protein [Pediococcus argentinicus]
MELITCASYYGSGSSVITDFVSEFDSVFSFTNEEFRFLQDPDGVSDLEYNLVENFNRHNSGHALKRYRNLVSFYSGGIFNKRYETYFNGNWSKFSYRYIDELTDFKFHGWWQYDLMDKGSFFYFRKRIINKLLHLTVWKNNPERTYNSMKNEITYGSHPSEEKFLRATKRYTEELFESVSDGKDKIMVDQLVPPTNLDRYIRYFNNIKIVIVDRDPRDLFVLEKFKWQAGVIPTDVVTFCKWFKYTRQHRQQDNLDTGNIKFVRFEDMVFNYEDTTNNLMQWLGLKAEDQSKRKQIFDPAKSQNNTKLWLNKKDIVKDIKYIEENLSEYLYE